MVRHTFERSKSAKNDANASVSYVDPSFIQNMGRRWAEIIEIQIVMKTKMEQDLHDRDIGFGAKLLTKYKHKYKYKCRYIQTKHKYKYNMQIQMIKYKTNWKIYYTICMTGMTRRSPGSVGTKTEIIVFQSGGSQSAPPLFAFL